MDWLAKMIGLPNDFLHSHADTTGGGVIQVRSYTKFIIFIKRNAI